MKNFVLFVVVSIAVVIVAQSRLPEGTPTYATVAWKESHGMVDTAMYQAFFALAPWEISNLGLVKVATTHIGNQRLELIADPISGKWHLSENGPAI